jgi:hypothetical protein
MERVDRNVHRSESVDGVVRRVGLNGAVVTQDDRHSVARLDPTLAKHRRKATRPLGQLAIRERGLSALKEAAGNQCCAVGNPVTAACRRSGTVRSRMTAGSGGNFGVAFTMQ